MSQQTKPIHIAIGKTAEGATAYFVVEGSEIVSEHRTAAEAVIAKGRLAIERMQSGSRVERRAAE